MVSHHFCFIKENMYRKPLTDPKMVWEVALEVVRFVCFFVCNNHFSHGRMLPLQRQKSTGSSSEKLENKMQERQQWP